MLVNWYPELTLDVDKKGELKCSASAKPLANVTWYIRTKGADVFLTSGMGTSVFRIPKVSKKDKGDYLCKAFNAHGKVEGKLKLNLAGKCFMHLSFGWNDFYDFTCFGCEGNNWC